MNMKQLLITRKFRDRILGGGVRQQDACLLREAPVVRRYVAIDLENPDLRRALEHVTKPFLARENRSIPPALVGSARKVAQAITAYERRISNHELFPEL